MKKKKIIAKRLAIVGIFYDGYKDLWYDFLNLFYRFWPNCPFQLFIVGQEVKIPEFDGVTFLSAGKDAEFSQKVRKALSEIDADYYLLLLEDFFFSKVLPENCLDNLLDYIYEMDIDYCALPLNEFKKSATFNGKTIDKDLCLKMIPGRANYTLSCQPSIWKKSFLKKAISSGNYNAWVFEGIYSMAEEAHKKCFLEKCICQPNNILHLKHGIVQGRFLPSTYRFFTKKEKYSFVSKFETMKGLALFKYRNKLLLNKILPRFFSRFIKKVFKGSSVIEKNKIQIIEELNNMGFHIRRGA